ncbi:hypothetical protein MRX96_038333 [Rhipicephalus microplus]
MSRVSRLAVLARNFTTSAIRRSGHDDHDTSGIPGSNLPFKINNNSDVVRNIGFHCVRQAVKRYLSIFVE